jgi:hypothetical protein
MSVARHCLCLFALVLSSMTASAAPTVCNTGLATASTSGCGPAINSPASNNLAADGNWFVSSNASGTFLGQAFVTVNNAFPNQNVGPRLANNAVDANGHGAGSSWITSSTDQASTSPNGATTFFTTSFALDSTVDLSTFVLSGFWMADDYASGIFLNGVLVPQAALPEFGNDGGPMVAFTIADGGQAAFHSGINTITFGIVDDSTNHGTIGADPSPVGFRAVLNIGTQVTTVPEPDTVALAAVGLLLMASVFSRRLKRAALM